jgi:hypothetical protein
MNKSGMEAEGKQREAEDFWAKCGLACVSERAKQEITIGNEET